MPMLGPSKRSDATTGLLYSCTTGAGYCHITNSFSCFTTPVLCCPTLTTSCSYPNHVPSIPQGTCPLNVSTAAGCLPNSLVRSPVHPPVWSAVMASLGPVLAPQLLSRQPLGTRSDTRVHLRFSAAAWHQDLSDIDAGSGVTASYCGNATVTAVQRQEHSYLCIGIH